MTNPGLSLKIVNGTFTLLWVPGMPLRRDGRWDRGMRSFTLGGVSLPELLLGGSKPGQPQENEKGTSTLLPGHRSEGPPAALGQGRRGS